MRAALATVTVADLLRAAWPQHTAKQAARGCSPSSMPSRPLPMLIVWTKLSAILCWASDRLWDAGEWAAERAKRLLDRRSAP